MDPAGNVTVTIDDDEGRTTETIQNLSSTISAATNITTNYAFNGGTALLSAMSVTTENAAGTGTQSQITAYVYGTGTPYGATPVIYRNDLVCAVISGLTSTSELAGLVGDVVDGDTSSLNLVQYQFDRQGETTQMVDQNGTQHDYTLDNLGRQVSDTVAALGTGVDGAVRRIDTAYDLLGNVALTTSYSSTSGGTDNIVNQVADTYNGLGVLTEEQQSVSGEVTDTTPAVLYGYSTDTATPTRLVTMTYPNGRVLTYGYDTGTDNAVGRVSYLADSDGTQLADYKYLGLDQIDDVSNPQPGIDLNLGAKNGSGQLADVDQFNRATDMVFAAIGGGANLQELKYGYDVSGNDLWQANPTATSNGVYLDKLNAYNALNELTSSDQGELEDDNTEIASNENENWSLDGMGNMSNYTQTVGGTTSVDQDRQTNGLNQITSYDSTSTWALPGYDAAGNMTTTPQPGNETTGLTCVYDAWDRLAAVYSGSTLVASYSYDGLNRRITETAGGNTTAFYYNSLPSPSGRGAGGEGDQVIEERVSSSPLPLGEGEGEGDETTAAIFTGLPANLQNVWGLRNVDDLILRDSAASGGNLGITGSGLGLRLYALQDANWNVIALVSASGSVQERFTYTAYGTATALNPNFSAYSGTNYHWTTLFAAMDTDPATGLDYDNARWYNASLGEFITTDPAQADPNTYRYAGDNPITQTDPTGEVAFGVSVWDPIDKVWRNSVTYRTNAEEVAFMANQAAAAQASKDARRAKQLAFANFKNLGGCGSIGSSLYSIGLNYWGAGQSLFYGNASSITTFQDAYDLGVLGQTQNSGGVTYYGTRGAIGVSTAAISLAGIVWAWGAAGLGQFAASVGPGAGWVPHFTFGWGAGGSYLWGQGLGSGLFVTTIGAGSESLTLTGIPILFPSAVGAWVATNPNVGNCFCAVFAGLGKGLGF